MANYQPSPNVTYFYDGTNVAGGIPNSKGKLTKVASSVSTTEYTEFDILGRVKAHKQTTDGVEYGGGTDQTKWMTYTYNLSGAMIEQQYPSGRVVKNTLDTTGDLQQVQSRRSNGTFRNYANSFNYTAAGAVSSMRLGNGRWENTTFNSSLQPTQIGLGSSAGDTSLLKLNYSYGTTANNGNVLTQDITVKRSGQSDLVFNQTYTYDELNRLKVAEERTGTTTNWKQTFTFDRYGNRKFDQSNTTQPASFSNANLTDPTFNASNNRMASGQNWTYDSAGNVTVDPDGRQFTYDAENKQVEAKNSSSSTLGTYYFDGDGKRIKKVVPNGETTVFVYDASGKLIGEYSTIVQPTQDAKVQYLTNDNLGTPRMNTDVIGNIVSRSDYIPYGEEIVNLGGRSSTDKYVADDVRQGFTGYENDGETGLDFAQARMYSKGLGRFHSADPLFIERKRLVNPGQLNLYTYTINNPLKFRDPLGLEVEIIFKNKKEKAAFLKEVNKALDGKYKVEVVKGKLQVVGGDKGIGKIGRSKLNNGQASLLGAITDKSKVGKVDLGDGKPNDVVNIEKYDSQGVNKVDTTDVGKITGGGITAGEIFIHAATEAYSTADGTSYQQAHHDVSQVGVGGMYILPGSAAVSPILNPADGGATITGYTLNNQWLSGRSREIVNPSEPGAMQYVHKFDTPIPKADLEKNVDKAKFAELRYSPNFKP